MGHLAWRWSLALLVAVGLSACGGDDDPLPEDNPLVPPGSCGPAEFANPDGECCPAGTIPNPAGPCCPAGTTPGSDGSCTPAGIPPELCADGFEPDGISGCAPILPVDPCPTGSIAVPGDVACQEVAPCGAGRWGDIPIDGSTQFVDRAYGGNDSDGSEARPWTAIQAGIDAAAPEGIVAVAAGSYPESVWIEDKPVRLWGVCPAQCEIVAPGSALAGIVIGAHADGTEVHNLAVTGAAIGMAMSGSHHLLLEQLWIHDTASRGVNVEPAWGDTEATLRSSLIERASDIGMFVAGSAVLVEDTVVRDTAPAGPESGRGLNLRPAPGTGKPATVILRGSLIDGNRDVAVFVRASVLTVDGTVLRNTQPDTLGNYGHGMHATDDLTTGAPSSVTFRGSLIDNNRGFGVLAQGIRLLVETTVLRNTWPTTTDEFGRGLEIAPDENTGTAGALTLRSSVVEHNHEFGVLVGGALATIESSIVRHTQPNARIWSGWGINAIDEVSTTLPADITVRGSVVEGNHTVGLFIASSVGLVEGTAIRGTLLDGRGWFGRGLEVVMDPTVGIPAAATVRHSLIEANRDAGVFVYDSHTTLEAVAVTGTTPDGEGRFGDGLVVIADQQLPATTELWRSALHGNTRAGLASFGSTVAMGGSLFDCNPIHLNGEQQYEFHGFDVSVPYRFDDNGENVCGCQAQSEECRVLSAGIAPPAPMTAED